MNRVSHNTKSRKRGFKTGHSELLYGTVSNRSLPNSELQKGFTLIEIVIVIVILSIISAITIKFVVDSLRIYTMAVNQKALFDEGKLALERMCRDIRDARSLTSPAAGGSGNMIRFRKDNATAYDTANEDIRFRLTGTNLEKDKATPNVTVILASNVSTFTVTRLTDNEIRLELTLSGTGGEQVTLRTKVYPKNLADSTLYRFYFQNWEETRS
jgi:prepilin-type N-terminal cleavage/methylation domain-containing protein